MSDNNICPSCRFEIEVTEVLSAQLRAQLQKEFEAKIREKETAIAERKRWISRRRTSMRNKEVNGLVAEQPEKKDKRVPAEVFLKIATILS